MEKKKKKKPKVKLKWSLFGGLIMLGIVGWYVAIQAYINLYQNLTRVQAGVVVRNEGGLDKEGVDEGAGLSPSDTIAKYFPDEYDIALAVAQCESQLDPTRIGDTHLAKPSVGLFQINQMYHPYSTEELLDTENNCRIAKEIRDRGSWDRWTCYRYGYYKKYLN